jgi:hypothetical protein
MSLPPLRPSLSSLPLLLTYGLQIRVHLLTDTP